MAIKTLPNSPLWPPNPSNAQAASPGPQAPPAKAPPAQSPTQDNYTHHTSPTPGDVQKHPAPAHPGKTFIKKMPSVPMHVTKHPNPVGRPKNR